MLYYTKPKNVYENRAPPSAAHNKPWHLENVDFFLMKTDFMEPNAPEILIFFSAECKKPGRPGTTGKKFGTTGDDREKIWDDRGKK